MFETGEVIDRKYRVDGICSNEGGMGQILFVTATHSDVRIALVLKYCRDTGEEPVQRFRREVRLMGSFKDNPRVVQIYDKNLEFDPPYFVMPFYEDGDLSRIQPKIRDSVEYQETIFLQMIECIQELHSRNVFHRDIKPKNFLIDGAELVVSDLGLTTELGSNTAFTQSSQYWGTPGFIPPEFLGGGFKNADATGDIFMLGKTFYCLISGRDSTYLMEDGIPPAIFHIIERCCSIPKWHRYQSLFELKQSLVAAYDVILGRSGGLGMALQLLSSINDKLEVERLYDPKEISVFVEQLAFLEDRDKAVVCLEIPHGFYNIIRQDPEAMQLGTFLAAYEKLVDRQEYGWSYAEVIASNMKVVFDGENVPLSEKAQALDLAIRAAECKNRFAAMDTCISMVKAITDESLGIRIATILHQRRDTFIARIEPAQCYSDAIRNALRQVSESQPNS
jgi:hypothetical protein